jgi:hypothetical protein
MENDIDRSILSDSKEREGPLALDPHRFIETLKSLDTIVFSTFGRVLNLIREK